MSDIPALIARTRKLRELTATGYTDPEIADVFGVSKRTVRTWRKAAGIPCGLSQVPMQPRHGTPAGYRSGCRDVCCRAPHIAAQRERREERQRDTARTASHAFDRWTPADDAVVMTRPALDAAYALGRTYLAVLARRASLNATYTARSRQTTA